MPGIWALSCSYWAHLSLPWFNSYPNPRSRNKINKSNTTPASLEKNKACPTTIGKIRTNSTSKIKKTTAIKKKRSEKGKRGDALGVKPHSKGLNFSRSDVYAPLNPRPRPTNSLPRVTHIASKDSKKRITELRLKQT